MKEFFDYLFPSWALAREERRAQRAEALRQRIAREAAERIQVREWSGKLYVAIDGHPLVAFTAVSTLDAIRATWAAFEIEQRAPRL